jgi:hypothetical protein
VIRSGYLSKLGEIRKTWKRRWFVLTPAELMYFTGTATVTFLQDHHVLNAFLYLLAENGKEQGTIPIATMTDAPILATATEQKQTQNPVPHCFVIHTKGAGSHHLHVDWGVLADREVIDLTLCRSYVPVCSCQR